MAAEHSPNVIARPFWSVMIPVYNRIEYLSEALASVLAQDPGPDAMQIAIVDDCSTRVDVPGAMREWGLVERVQLFRTPKHVSIGAAWNECIANATGRWIHIMHSDDVVGKGYYESLQRGIGAVPTCGMAFCRGATIDDRGIRVRDGILEQQRAGLLSGRVIRKMIVGSRIHCPSVSVRRETYATVGGFREDLPYSLDWEMWQRIALRYPVWYEPKILFSQRRHSLSETVQCELTQAWLRDIRNAIEIVREYLPARNRSLYHRALARCGSEAVWRAVKMLKSGFWSDAIRSLKSAPEVCLPAGRITAMQRTSARIRMIADAPLFIAGRIVTGAFALLRHRRVSAAPGAARTLKQAKA